MLAAIPGMVHGPARVNRPMVREGWLKHRDRNRGADRFVEVGWDEALDLVAGELQRVKADHDVFVSATREPGAARTALL